MRRAIVLRRHAMCLCWSQSHEYPENDEANARHQDQVTCCFTVHQCLPCANMLEIPSRPWAGVLPPRAGRRPFSRSDPVLRFVSPRQTFVRRCHRLRRLEGDWGAYQYQPGQVGRADRSRIRPFPPCINGGETVGAERFVSRFAHVLGLVALRQRFVR